MPAPVEVNFSVCQYEVKQYELFHVIVNQGEQKKILQLLTGK